MRTDAASTHRSHGTMKRRLRKKKRLGEFQELGFEVTFQPLRTLPESEREERIWEFLGKAIEANELMAGGGLNDPVSLFVTSAKRRGTASEQQRSAVREWLAAQSWIESVEVGPLVDACYEHD